MGPPLDLEPKHVKFSDHLPNEVFYYTLVSEPGKIGPAGIFAIFRSGVYLFELTGFSSYRSRRDLHFPGVILSKSRFSNHFAPPAVGNLTFQRPSHFSRSGVYLFELTGFSSYRSRPGVSISGPVNSN